MYEQHAACVFDSEFFASNFEITRIQSVKFQSAEIYNRIPFSINPVTLVTDNRRNSLSCLQYKYQTSEKKKLKWVPLYSYFID